MKVVGLKLITGEDVIAEKIENTLDGVIVKRPLVLQMQMTPQGPHAGFSPWSLLMPENTQAKIKDEHIMVIFDLASEVETQYMQLVTGINLAPASQILHG